MSRLPPRSSVNISVVLTRVICSVVVQQAEEIKWLKQQQFSTDNAAPSSQHGSLPNYRRFTPDEV